MRCYKLQSIKSNVKLDVFTEKAAADKQRIISSSYSNTAAPVLCFTLTSQSRIVHAISLLVYGKYADFLSNDPAKMPKTLY